jgi:glycosyltransferase involved in cell wall biosynthesis
MARIAIDGRKYFDFGIGTYIQQLVCGLSGLDAPHDFHLYTEPGGSRRIQIDPRWTRSEVSFRKYSVGEIVLFAREVRKDGIDLFHAPHYTLPAGLQGRSVVTVHDLIQLRFPEYFSLPQRVYARRMIDHALRHAGAVVTNSEFTKTDILASFQIAPEKIHVTHFAIDASFARINDARIRSSFLVAQKLGKPYLLYVGSMKPHKNIPLLLRAFAAIRKESDVALAIVGESLFRQGALARLAGNLGITGHIRDLGVVKKADLLAAYSCAEALVLPSQYEGFGFPALEAMACGTPVVASDAASLPEICGGAALHFASGDEAALRDALRGVIASAQLCGELSEKGLKNVKRFSWRATAEKTLRIYESLLV